MELIKTTYSSVVLFIVVDQDGCCIWWWCSWWMLALLQVNCCTSPQVGWTCCFRWCPHSLQEGVKSVLVNTVYNVFFLNKYANILALEQVLRLHLKKEVHIRLRYYWNDQGRLKKSKLLKYKIWLEHKHYIDR